MSKNYDQLMVDIETMGTRSYSAIVSIAAVPFNWRGETGNAFEVNIDLQSCVNAKLRIDVSTVKWWMQQDLKAMAKVHSPEDPLQLKDAMLKLRTLINASYNFEGIWGNGCRFDLGLIENAADSVGVKDMWPYWVERDVRTLVYFAPNIKKQTPFRGTAHTPVDDCLHQIEYCCAIYNKLKI